MKLFQILVKYQQNLNEAYEQNILVRLIYGLIIIFLNSRKYFILNEIKNNGQYYFYYLISFFFAIRLIILTNNNSDILNYLAHINVYILLAYYCFINKRNFIYYFIDSSFSGSCKLTI